MARKLWGGRFAKPTDPRVERFSSSIAVDWRLAAYDVIGSIAHAKMLGKCRIIPSAVSATLVRGLQAILKEIEAGRFAPDPTAEDIHSQIQQMLQRRIGEAAHYLHTARSRNDQVALDLRLYCRDAVRGIQASIVGLQRSLVAKAVDTVDVVIPGYTHLQQAQPIVMAHQFLAYVEMLQRDIERLAGAWARANVLPLGSGALAGTSLPIDRQFVAKELGFARISDNSLDAVADRDFALELLADLAFVAMHLSRLAEDLILWATEEFGFIELDDAFATGSSLMPQKKNPDVLELVRGAAGLAAGAFVSLLTVLKGLPLSYNRDLQHDKTVLFQAVDLVHESLEVLAPFIRSLRVRRARVAALFASDALCATDVAEYLVERGVPARQAHAIVGRLVDRAERQGRRLADFSAQELTRFSPAFDAGVRAALDPRRSVARKRSWGSPNPRLVKQQIATWKKRLQDR
jgi:argininosuccinate lyase